MPSPSTTFMGGPPTGGRACIGRPRPSGEDIASAFGYNEGQFLRGRSPRMQSPTDENTPFVPTGAMASFVLMVVSYAVFWFALYALMAQRS